MHACVCIRSLSLVLFACALTDCHLLLAITYALSGQTTSSPRGPVVDQSCNDLLRHFPSIWFNHLSETIDAIKFPINGTGVVIRDGCFVFVFFARPWVTGSCWWETVWTVGSHWDISLDVVEWLPNDDDAFSPKRREGYLCYTVKLIGRVFYAVKRKFFQHENHSVISYRGDVGKY